MANGWDGADPVAQSEPGIDYELATRYLANDDVRVTAIRVWAGATSAALSGRMARLWSTGGALLASVALPDQLPAGWSQYTLAAAVEIAQGNSVDVSYSTITNYGAIAGGYPNPSADTLVTATQGAFHPTPGSHYGTGGTVTGSFYGVDIVYQQSGDLPPTVDTLVAVPDGLDVDATVTITDEAGGGVTVDWFWGDGERTDTAAGVLTASHTYAAAGLYALMAIAYDTAGQSGGRAVPVIVRDDTGLFDLAAAVEELAERLATITGLMVHQYGPGAKRLEKTPAGIVTLPTEPIQYHETYNQGGPAASATIPIIIAVSKVHSPSAFAAIAQYLNAGGARSVRAVIESGVYTAFDDVTVADGVTDDLPIAGDTYLSAVFNAKIMR